MHLQAPSRTLFIPLTLIIIILFSLPLVNAAILAPGQPATGPGGSNYTHQEVKTSVYGEGATQYWIFEPASPKPASAPVLVFNHGWLATSPTFYQAWINHLVKQGYIVIYPRYQEDFTTPSDKFTPNAFNSTLEALKVLETDEHVRPLPDQWAVVGHSVGGLISVNMASSYKEYGLAPPLAVFAVEPGRSRSSEDQVGPLIGNLSNIPPETLLLTLAGDQDTWVGNYDAIRIINQTPQIPIQNKDYILMVSDTHGTPELMADHFAPLAASFRINGWDFDFLVNAQDYYGTWKLMDGLLDASFQGTNQEYALGNTTPQRFMGFWSDGQAVKELVVTDNP
jgi:pimeloyl-ACP methyl ester carboxylesterase